jgi:hypothetical protein
MRRGKVGKRSGSGSAAAGGGMIDASPDWGSFEWAELIVVVGGNGAYTRLGGGLRRGAVR